MLRKQTAKITLNFPQELLSKVDSTATELKVTRTDLIRSVLEEYIRSLVERKLKRQLIEGYKANAGLLRETSEEFKFVDGENV